VLIADVAGFHVYTDLKLNLPLAAAGDGQNANKYLTILEDYAAIGDVCVLQVRIPNETATRPPLPSRGYRACRSSQSLHCISAAPAALDRYLAALPAMLLTPVAPFASESKKLVDEGNQSPTRTSLIGSILPAKYV
jgi:hypothetical protein